jgi:hypothetical protein
VRILIRLLTICSILILSSGCTPSLVNLPNLKLPDCPVVEQKVCPEVTQVACKKLDVPDQVPKNLIIEIRDGKAINLDQGGENLLRQYLATRKALKAQ